MRSRTIVISATFIFFLLIVQTAFATQVPIPEGATGKTRSCIAGLSGSEAQTYFATLTRGINKIDSGKCRLGTEYEIAGPACVCKRWFTDFYEGKRCLNWGLEDGSGSCNEGDEAELTWSACINAKVSEDCVLIGINPNTVEAPVLAIDVEELLERIPEYRRNFEEQYAQQRPLITRNGVSVFGKNLIGDPPSRWRAYLVEDFLLSPHTTRDGDKYLVDLINRVPVWVVRQLNRGGDADDVLIIRSPDGDVYARFPFHYYFREGTIDDSPRLSYLPRSHNPGFWRPTKNPEPDERDRLWLTTLNENQEEEARFVATRYNRGSAKYPGGAKLYRGTTSQTAPCSNNRNIIQIILPSGLASGCLGETPPIWLPTPKGTIDRGGQIRTVISGRAAGIETAEELRSILLYDTFARSLRTFGGWAGVSAVAGFFG